MFAQHAAYSAKNFTGGRPCAYCINKQIGCGGSIGAAQCSSHNAEIWPPRMQFSIRHDPSLHVPVLFKLVRSHGNAI